MSATSWLRVEISFCVAAMKEVFCWIRAAFSSVSRLNLSRFERTSAISTSQKLFWLASAIFSSSRRPMRSLMMSRTFTKWSGPSASALMATAASTGLSSFERRCMARASTAAAFELLERSCRKEAAAFFAVFSCGFAATAFTVAFTAERPVSFLLALKLDAAPSLRVSLASERAVSSAARALERWSNSVARFSHSLVSSVRKAVSASLASSSSDFMPSASSFSSVFFAESVSALSLADALALFSCSQARTFFSDMALASNSVW
mmetsp:Transcript_41728/g.123824  ORF Transcript_41728/g.123824 Transcript_41728/m.123824 type:complete len:263 (-) Transcript_41728:731-1519(-)